MEFWRKVFSNDDGAPSSNRVFLAAILVVLIIWGNLIVVRTGSIPAIPETWLYLVGIFSGVVAFTKGAAAYQAGKGAPDGSSGGNQ
jgi:hypothetical protein